MWKGIEYWLIICLPSNQELEEQVENWRHEVADAERIAKKAEEELAVAKERLLLQENELQSKSGKKKKKLWFSVNLHSLDVYKWATWELRLPSLLPCWCFS